MARTCTVIKGCDPFATTTMGTLLPALRHRRTLGRIGRLMRTVVIGDAVAIDHNRPPHWVAVRLPEVHDFGFTLLIFGSTVILPWAVPTAASLNQVTALIEASVAILFTACWWSC